MRDYGIASVPAGRASAEEGSSARKLRPAANLQWRERADFFYIDGASLFLAPRKF
jgi:hypothetical protein